MNDLLPSEYVIRGGRVVDGTGRPAVAADVVVEEGRLRLASPGETSGLHVVDIEGRALAPGFIDTHSHADLEAFLGDSQVHGSRLVQGVTTEVTGNCGFTPYPVPGGIGDLLASFLAVVFGPHAQTFEDFDTYAEAMTAAGLASNIAPLVGHGTLRAATLGYENRPVTEVELSRMSDTLSRQLESGAFGLSTGLCYTPATYAPTEEVAALAAVTARAGAIYSTHIRNETDRTAASIDEALAVARTSGVAVHISHLKVAGRNHWGTSADFLAMLDEARAGGVDVTADVYPYTAASTSLHSLLPPWTATDGMDALYAHLRDPAWRRRVAHDLEAGIPGWQNLGTAAGWDNVTVATSAARPDWEGASIESLATEGDESPVDAIARVLDANRGKVVVVIEAMAESDVADFLAWPHTVVGSDGIPLPGRPHPRLTGTFPRVLGRYTDRLGSMEQAVHRMTGASAARFGLEGRGVIDHGKVADLVVFDPETVVDRGTYADPWQRPAGIDHVLLAGRPAVWDSEVVADSSGAVLRRGS